MKIDKLILISFLALIPASASQAIVVSTGPAPGPHNNAFPFQALSGDRYQQVYNADLFPNSSIINSISFFQGLLFSTFATADYHLYLSTSNNPVNALSPNLGNNVGADNALFWSGSLSGPVGTSFTFDGIDFKYNPHAGDLLLDIRVSNITSSGTGAMLASSNWTGNVTSRAHNFGTGFANYGLVTDFEVAQAVPSNANTFLLLSGVLFGLAVLRSRISEKSGLPVRRAGGIEHHNDR